MYPLFRSLAVCLITSAACHAEIIIKGQDSTSTLAYAGDVSSTDLINAGQPTLASASVSTSNSNFPVSGVNDGIYANTWNGNTFFESDVHFPAVATYQLNLASAPNGYDITSITSLIGWNTYARNEANQNYTVEVSVVGSAGFRPLAHVKNSPFSGIGGNYETKVTITEDTAGVLARNVSAIRFIFADPGNDGQYSGTIVREIDVNGSPSTATPPVATVQTVTDFSESDDAYAGDVVNDDLVNKRQPSLAAFACSTVPDSGAGGEYDGLLALDNKATGACYRAAQMPATLTFCLNTTSSPNGYVISAIQSYAGWKNAGTQSCANQKYTVEYCNIGSSEWLFLTTVDFSPFSSLIDTPASTRVELSAPTGKLLSGVASLRFTLQVPTRANGANSGTVLQEIDVIGYPVKTPN